MPNGRLHLDWRTEGVPKDVDFTNADFNSTLDEPEFILELIGGGGYKLRSADK